VDAVLSVTDSALRAVSAGVRGTLRFSSTARFDLGQRGSGAFTITADHSGLHQIGTIEDRGYEEHELESSRAPKSGGFGAALPPRASSYSPTVDSPEIFQELAQSNTGFSTQMNATLFDRLSLSGGVRVERQLGGGASTHFATLPMAGTAYTLRSGALTMKLRASYGKGVRWPQLAAHQEGYLHTRSPNLNLAPEQQSGLEAGVDFLLGHSLKLQATRFDQTASGLIQRSTTADGDDDDDDHLPRLMWENVGEISNRGWELQARFERGALSLIGNVALVDSRVRRVADGYAGDLRAGDRMLAVPARTFGLTAAWTRPNWYAGVTAYRAADWINYDRLALAQVLVDANKAGTQVPGAQLRSFWRQYDGNMHLRASLSRELGRGWTGYFTADNLFNYQVGEPDNITIIPGRTISFGLRAAF
jgi:iron complex outermembrane receptor protein